MVTMATKPLPTLDQCQFPISQDHMSAHTRHTMLRDSPPVSLSSGHLQCPWPEYSPYTVSAVSAVSSSWLAALHCQPSTSSSSAGNRPLAHACHTLSQSDPTNDRPCQSQNKTQFASSVQPEQPRCRCSLLTWSPVLRAV